MNRRDFVGLAAAGWAGACASLVVTTVMPENGRLRLSLSNHPLLNRPGGFLKIRPEGSDRLLYVLALSGGSFAVVSPICKHLGCTVNIDGPQLLCPCHGSMYDRDGSVLRGPTQAPLDQFQTEVSSDGILTIHLETDRT